MVDGTPNKDEVLLTVDGVADANESDEPPADLRDDDAAAGRSSVCFLA